MKIDTSRFGSIDIEEEQIFTFPMGILGFAKCKRFVVIDHTEESPFKWLQSLDEGGLAFIITDPLFFRPDYHVKLRRSELSMLGSFVEDDLVVSVIMTIPENPQEMSANLMAPVISICPIVMECSMFSRTPIIPLSTLLFARGSRRLRRHNRLVKTRKLFL